MCCINSANIASGYLTMPPKINPTPLEINPNTHTQTNSGFLETSDILIPIPHYHQFCCSWGITVTPAAQILQSLDSLDHSGVKKDGSFLGLPIPPAKNNLQMQGKWSLHMNVWSLHMKVRASVNAATVSFSLRKV